MEERKAPPLILIEVDEVRDRFPELMKHCENGTEVVLTRSGVPCGMLAPVEIMRSMSNCGLIDFELPFDLGGYGWCGPEESHEAKAEADGFYKAELERRQINF